MADRLVLIHGFTQNAASWAGLTASLAVTSTGNPREVVAVDAPGHGGRAQVIAGLWETADLLAGEGGRASYLGYSLGGRLALHIALAHPDVVERLVLVSTTPGIADDAARSQRRSDDDALAADLERTGDVDDFLERWLASPLFATLPRDRAGLSARRTNTAAGLASSLRLCGTGRQENLWERLSELRMPTLVIAGGADTKYTAIAEQMVAGLPDARLHVVAGAGHAVHLEQPEVFVEVVQDFLG